MYDYRLQWTWMVAMAAAIAVAWASWVLVSRWPAGAKVFIGAGVAATLVLTAINTGEALTAEDPDEPRSSDLRRVAASVLDELPEGDGDVILRYREPGSTAYGVGLLLQLERHGVAAKVERDTAHVVGDSRVHRRTAEVRAVLRVATDDVFDALLAGGQEGRLVAYAGEEPLAERQRILREIGPARDRIEDRPESYHAEVREGFLRAAREGRDRPCPYYPAPIVVVDASADPEVVAGRIQSEVERALALDPRS
jgi:hypothetical protein